MSHDSTISIDSLPCGVFSFTDEGTLTGINNTLLTLLHYTKEELEGASVEKIFTLSTRIFYQTHFTPLLKLQLKVDEIFLNLLAKNKEVIPVLVNAVNNNTNNISINTCACITVYERQKYEKEILLSKKAAEEALNKNEELLKAKNLLEAGNQELDRQLTELKNRNKELLQLNDLIAHDLQEPVRKIALYMDIVTKNPDFVPGKKIADAFKVIIKSAERMRNVLHSLQEYMAISTNKLVKTRVDLKELVTTQLKEIATHNPNVSFFYEVEELPAIYADEKQLEMLFTLLFKNCIQFRNPEINLQILVSSCVVQENFYNSIEGKYRYIDVVKITVADNGVGFNEQYNELIFKILKKLEVKSANLGFGLAICKRIAENHRGYIKAASRENIGTKITVTLPMETNLL